MTAKSSIVKEMNESGSDNMKENSINSNTHGKSIDTGKAAILAYTNIENVQFEDNVNQVQTDWRKSQNTRNSASKVSSAENH